MKIKFPHQIFLNVYCGSGSGMVTVTKITPFLLPGFLRKMERKKEMVARDQTVVEVCAP